MVFERLFQAGCIIVVSGLPFDAGHLCRLAEMGESLCDECANLTGIRRKNSIRDEAAVAAKAGQPERAEPLHIGVALQLSVAAQLLVIGLQEVLMHPSILPGPAGTPHAKIGTCAITTQCYYVPVVNITE